MATPSCSPPRPRGRGGSRPSASSRTSCTCRSRRRPDAPEQSAGQFWTDFIRDTAPEFRKPTIEQLTTFVQPTWQALIDGAMYCEPQLREIIARQRPDVIVEDNVNCFPALLTGGVPFVRMASCNPLEVTRPRRPPGVQRLRERRPHRVGRVPRRVRPDPSADVAGVRRVGAARAAPAAARPRLHPHERAPEPVPLPGGGRLHGPSAARPHLDPARFVGARHRRRRSRCPSSSATARVR